MTRDRLKSSRLQRDDVTSFQKSNFYIDPRPRHLLPIEIIHYDNLSKYSKIGVLIR